MKHRIKVVLDANVASGGQPVRAWLQYDTETEKTIKECRKAFAKQLGLNDADALELAIEGFIVLDSLSSDTLDASKDIVEIRRRQQPPNGNSRDETRKAKRRKVSAAVKQDVLPKELLLVAHQGQISPLPALPTSTETQNKASSSKIDVGYSSDSSSTSASSSAMSSSSSCSSSSSSSSSSSESSSSSSMSLTTSSSSSSNSSTSSGTHPVFVTASAPVENTTSVPFSLLDKSASSTIQTDVPPGQGKASTRARNLRKRIRKQHLKRAAADIEDESGLQRPKTAETADASKASSGKSTALPDTSHRPQTQASAPNTADGSRPDPTGQTQREDLKMLSLASGNSKKAKSLRRDMLNGRRQTNKKIVYADGDAMSMDVTPDSSAILANLTQITQVGDASAQTVSKSTISSTGKQAQKPVDFFPNGVSKRPPPPPPSTRSDLPANVTVTSVDVEAEDFVPGVHTPNFLAPPQVPYFSQGKTPIESSSKSDTTAAAGSKSTLDASAYFNAYSGYYGAVPSKGKGKQKKQAGSSKGANGETVPVNVERYAASLDENHWSGWPTLEDIEGGLFDTYASVTAPGDGEKVAVKILELSPTSFLPALSLYFGLVLSLTSSPHSSAIRLKLHPSCRPNAGLEEHDLNTDGVEGGETEPHYPRYFGEDLESPLEDADHPDIKEIKLDDIVDCRRVVLA